ncbi:hypothetical protein [Dactylosporangium sp. NPDC006015]|uniref:hypothetical protein n=1 Tax=Dactylosporangium sp. NPDC006015 TaxID=3154576 RepID=UPI0033BDE6AA
MTKRSPFTTAALVLAAIINGGPGVWAFFAPRSFYDVIATYPPYNEHLFHDIGAFELGLTAAILISLVWRDGLSVALFGGSVGATVHAVAHFLDRDLGGRSSDPWTLGAVAVVLTAGLVAHRRRPTRT